MINGGGRALDLHSQRMKQVSYVQPVIREPEDSWHRSVIDSWIHIFNKIVPISKDPMWNNSETSVKLVTNI